MILDDQELDQVTGGLENDTEQGSFVFFCLKKLKISVILLFCKGRVYGMGKICPCMINAYS